MSGLGGSLLAGSDAQPSDAPALTANPTIVEEARSGSAEAWEVIYRRLGAALTRYAASRGVPDPEDVAQDVMWVVASRIEGFTGDWDELRSWLFTIAYRRCADHHRRSYRRPEKLTDHVPDWADPAGAADGPVWANGAAEEALAALEILDKREREVVTLRIIGELPTHDVASATGLSVGNVRVIQSRALRKLRSHLENNGGMLDKRFRIFPFPLITAAWRRVASIWGEGNAERVGRASAPASTAAAVPAAVSASTVGASSLAVGSAVVAVAMAATMAAASVPTPPPEDVAPATHVAVEKPVGPDPGTAALQPEPGHDPASPGPSPSAPPDPAPIPPQIVRATSDVPSEPEAPPSAATEGEAQDPAPTPTVATLIDLSPLVNGSLANLADVLSRLGVGGLVDLSEVMATIDLVTGTIAETSQSVEHAVGSGRG